MSTTLEAPRIVPDADSADALEAMWSAPAHGEKGDNADSSSNTERALATSPLLAKLGAKSLDAMATTDTASNPLEMKDISEALLDEFDPDVELQAMNILGTNTDLNAELESMNALDSDLVAESAATVRGETVKAKEDTETDNKETDDEPVEVTALLPATTITAAQKPGGGTRRSGGGGSPSTTPGTTTTTATPSGTTVTITVGTPPSAPSTGTGGGGTGSGTGGGNGGGGGRSAGEAPAAPEGPERRVPDAELAARQRYDAAMDDYARHAARKASRLFQFSNAAEEYNEAREELNSAIRALAAFECEDVLLNRTPARSANPGNPDATPPIAPTAAIPAGAPGSAGLTPAQQGAQITNYLVNKYAPVRTKIIENLAKEEVKGPWRKTMDMLKTPKGKVFLALGIVASSLAIAGTFGGGLILGGALFTAVRVTSERTTRALPTDADGGTFHALLPGQASVDAREAIMTHPAIARQGTQALFAASENLIGQIDASTRRERRDRYHLSLTLGVLAGAATFSIGHAFAAFAHQQAFGGDGTIRGLAESGRVHTYVPTHGESLWQMFGGHFFNVS